METRLSTEKGWLTKITATLGLILLAATADAAAKNIYASPAGNDANPGTMAQPVATPRKALQLASAGDVIFLRSGRYSGY